MHFQGDYCDEGIDYNSSSEEERVLSKTSGCRIIAGTTNGDLRVWETKDILGVNLVKRNLDDGRSNSTPSDSRDDILDGKKHADIL